MSFDDIEELANKIQFVYDFFQRSTDLEVSETITGLTYDARRRGYMMGRIVFDFDQSSENMFSIGEDGYISHRPTNDMVAEINYSKHDIDYDFTEEVYFQLSTLYEEKIVQNIMIASYCQKHMDREFYLDTDKLNYFYSFISLPPGVKSK